MPIDIFDDNGNVDPEKAEKLKVSKLLSVDQISLLQHLLEGETFENLKLLLALLSNRYYYDSEIKLEHNNVECSAHKLLTPLNTMNQKLSTMETNLAQLKTLLTETNTNLQQSHDIVKHIHDSHLHGKSHYSEDGYNVDPGDYFLANPINEVNLLMHELDTGVDKDENGLIYAIDFIIDVNDVNKPSILVDKEMLMQKNGYKFPAQRLTWDQYRNTLPWT